MKEIGGFFEFEFDKKHEYHKDCIERVNSGRNAFAYILKAKKIKKVYLPYFICQTVIEPIETLGIEYEFYAIDERLEILDLSPSKLGDKEKLLYINYFGVKNDYVNELSQLYTDKLIIDNTQAFFKRPSKGIDTWYSARKFFGVADGGYVYTDVLLEENLEKDISYDKCVALLGRADGHASDAYPLYVEHNKIMCHRPLKKMSKLTQSILESINYEKIKITRERNFFYLHTALKNKNRLKFFEESIEGPMVYPFWIDVDGLREFLIQEKIYVPTYWKEVLDYIPNTDQLESSLVHHLLAIPIDQRYDLKDMKTIIDAISKFLSINL